MNNRASRRLRMGGFTLIEVLASMAVLVVLILALTRMFVEAANITKRGTTALARNSMGATAINPANMFTNLSSGPNSTEGRSTVAAGKAASTAASPAALLTA